MNDEDAMRAALEVAFGSDDQTTVLLVKGFRTGEDFPNPTMEQMVYPNVPARFAADLTLVKLLVGPASPGPAGAPSTSRGIGIEIWLPSKDAWNERFHAVGGSGWANGTEEAVPDKISTWTGGADTRSAPRIAAEEGAVTATTDSGYPNTRTGSFLMNPDGSFNERGYDDWSYRSLYLQATVSKALISAYYGKPPSYSYFDGASGGGRQAFHVAHNLPEQYDGVLASVPALNWNEFVANLYPALVIQRDLGGKPLSRDQLSLVSNAAIAAADFVDGQHLGFILDHSKCRYDPTNDPGILSTADGGANDTAAALTRDQARAVNKFWYGMTRDGSVPDPAIDNGWDAPAGSDRLWYGIPRGADLSLYVDPGSAFTIGADLLALVAGDPKLGHCGFANASGTGQNDWMKMDYEELAQLFERAKTWSYRLGPDNPDLSEFKGRNGKLLNVVHVEDNLLWSQGATDYYERVIALMGGLEQVQSFYRLYLMPGLGHGEWNGTMNPLANPPLPAERQMYQLLVDWVENAIPPDEVVLTSLATREKERALAAFPPISEPAVSLPIYPYPAKPIFTGGDIFRSDSYTRG